MWLSWQTLPLQFDSIAFTFGGVSVSWYTLCYLTGIIFVTLFFVSLLRRKGLLGSEDTTIELITSVLWGVIIGARFGYILLYGDASYLEEPWRIISPYDFTTHTWIGIRGLSFHGGLLGGAIGLWRFTREANRHFWDFADVLVQALPLGLFFGRIGNFLNHEILGQITTAFWGMQIFPNELYLRHPVTLYEALGEGILLFFFLDLSARLSPRSGVLSSLFLIGYGVIRFALENWRDTPLLPNFFLTMGQTVSLAMLLAGCLLLLQRALRPLEHPNEPPVVQ